MRFYGVFKKSLVWYLVLVFGVFNGFISAQNPPQNQNAKPTASKDVERRPQRAVLVKTAKLQSGVFNQTYQYVGSLYFSERGMLASEVSGIIDAMFVSEGERVRKGQKLVVLNSDLLRDEIASKEGLLKQAKAQYEKTKHDYARYKTLYENASISFKEYEDIAFDLQAQQGNLESISNALESLKTQKRKKTLVAPYDGVILQRMLKQGEWVSSGASVFDIAKLNPLEATFEVSFEVLRALRVGDSLEVQIANKDYPARVSALIPLGDAKARTFPLKLTIDDPKGELIEGLEVRAAFVVKGNEKLFLLPRDGILPQGRENVVFTIKDNRAKQVKVLVRGYEGLQAFIEPLEEGLELGGKVIIVGAESLRDGVEVQE